MSKSLSAEKGEKGRVCKYKLLFTAGFQNLISNIAQHPFFNTLKREKDVKYVSAMLPLVVQCFQPARSQSTSLFLFSKRRWGSYASCDSG
jgi:hypothetical protein